MAKAPLKLLRYEPLLMRTVTSDLALIGFIFVVVLLLFANFDVTGKLIAAVSESDGWLVDEIVPAIFVSLLFSIYIALRRLRSIHSDSQRARYRYRTILNSVADGVIGLDDHGRISFMNRSAEKLLDWSEDELTGLLLHDRIHHHRLDGSVHRREDSPIFKSISDGTEQQVNQDIFWDRRGKPFAVEYTSTPVRFRRGVTGTVVLFRDITKRVQAEHELEEQQKHLDYLAHHDTLTDLPNRLLFHDRMKQSLAKSVRHDQQLGVMLLDLDRFKNINDSLGHEVGDRVLQEVSSRLLRTVRQEDTIARLGGDEFAVLLQNIQGEKLGRVAEKIIAQMAQPISIGNLEYTITSSVGIAIYPFDAKDESGLMSCADTAMYRAKEKGRNRFEFFTHGMGNMVYQRLRMENDLRQAVKLNQLQLYYQPRFDLADQRLVAVEALLRWAHPERGIVAPMEFIPLAEETGLILDIGHWVIRAACEQIAAWRDNGVEVPLVSINLSTRQFQDSNLVQSLHQVLQKTAIHPASLELEVMESTAAQETAAAIRTMVNLKELGFSLAIDNFGIGNSSFTYLRRYPIDTFKIDKSFIKDIGEEVQSEAIIEAIIALGKSLNMVVVAEGVESAAQAEFLRKKGCPQGQGYHFQRPAPPEEFIGCLEAHCVCVGKVSQ